MGVGLRDRDSRFGTRGPATAFGVGGSSGSFAYGHSATGIAFALTKNRLTQDFDAVTRINRLVTRALAGD